MVSHTEHEAMQENRLEEIKLSVGITKARNIVTINDKSHSTQEEKRNKGTGVGAS